MEKNNFICLFVGIRIYLCLGLLKKEMYHQQKFYTLILFRQVDHLYKSEIKEVLIQILVEHQNYFFSIQMFGHLKQLFEHSGVDTGCFRHQYTNFGHSNFGMPKFNLK